MNRIHSFEPIVGESPQLLILGSMPSVKSLEAGQYYGNRLNHFWGLVGAAAGVSFPQDYPGRKELLNKLGIALWDSVFSCERAGSLDKDIQNEAPNDVNGLIARNPTIQAVFFNGTAAQRLYMKHNTPINGIVYILLPSSSPVPRRNIKKLDVKLEYWRKIADFLKSPLLDS